MALGGRTGIAGALAAMMVAVVSAGGLPTPPAHADDRPGGGLLAPDSGAWFGVSIDWAHDTLAAYSRRLGHAPAVAVTFAGFPLSAQEKQWLDQSVDQAADEGSMLLLTLEPRDGLDEVTSTRARALAGRLARYNRRGVSVFVRLAHEMNGSWYPWGQQPGAYVEAFRRVATQVHRRTSRTAMMWAPNYGGGYPFVGGPHETQPGEPGFELLDTDDDGRLSMTDDPYAPYWPGRRHVDWAGMSLYHWGNVYPWGENEVPEPGKYVSQLRGTYRGAGGDDRAVPDFYAEYGARMRLPVAITETAAMYVAGRGGADELAVKRGWWRQAFAARNHRTLPWVKMVNWFEWRKHEPEVGGEVDWTATRDDRVRSSFRSWLPPWLRYAPGSRRSVR